MVIRKAIAISIQRIEKFCRKFTVKIQGKRILVFIIYPEMNFRAKSKSRLKVGLGSEP